MKSIADEMGLFTSIMKALAAQWGEKCEVVLHDWSKGYEQTIVAIENGHVTGRKVGDCGSNLGLEVMRGTVENGDRYNYITQTKDGKSLRSTTVYIKDDEGIPLGALCTNIDISDLMAVKKTMDSLTMATEDNSEYFAANVNELLDYLIAESISKVGKAVVYMTKEDKIEALAFLDSKGAFLITKSGEKVCKYFNMSKFTLYSYLEEIRSLKPVSSGATKALPR